MGKGTVFNVRYADLKANRKPRPQPELWGAIAGGDKGNTTSASTTTLYKAKTLRKCDGCGVV